MDKVLITGGMGFIGTNLAVSLKNKFNVICIDNFYKKESLNNVAKLDEYKIENTKLDITNKKDIKKLITENKFDTIVHLGAQVSMIDSIEDPQNDLNTNLIGTFNLLDSIRKYSNQTKFINISSNKVYGDLSWDKLQETDSQYISKNYKYGYDESIPLQFSGPYGCSKGSAEQYVVDHNKTYNLRTTSLRLSTIYGPNQFYTYNQGWVGWFIKSFIDQLNNDVIEISFHGDGKQVRDILYIDDFTNLIKTIINKFKLIDGEIFNIGGSHHNAISIINLIDILKDKFSVNKEIKYIFKDWRPADQKVYISDIRKINNSVSWKPETEFSKGLDLYIDWIKNHN